MALPVVSAGAYRRLTFAALVMVTAIIVTGAAVRLSGSGLGCPDWPSCERGALVSMASSHQTIEQVNRLFTGLMVVALVVTVLASVRQVPRRRDLVWLSVSLVVGIIGQGVVGGIVVLTHLHPAAVQLHYLLSIAIVTAAMVLHRRAGEGLPPPYRATVPAPIVRHVRAIVVLLAAVLVAGTVVTGSGPHSGDAREPEKIRRFGFAITTVTRIHSVVVWLAVAAVVALVWRLRTVPAARAVLDDALSLLVLAMVVQGGIGYVQYALGVPAALVGVHVLGSTLVWIAAMHLLLSCRAPSRVSDADVAWRDTALAGDAG